MEHRSANLLTQLPTERNKDKVTTKRMKRDLEKEYRAPSRVRNLRITWKRESLWGWIVKGTTS